MKSVLDQEIKWCRANRGKSGKGKAFEDGFIAGLKQAKFLYAAQHLRAPDALCSCYMPEIYQLHNDTLKCAKCGKPARR